MSGWAIEGMNRRPADALLGLLQVGCRDVRFATFLLKWGFSWRLTLNAAWQRQFGRVELFSDGDPETEVEVEVQRFVLVDVVY